MPPSPPGLETKTSIGPNSILLWLKNGAGIPMGHEFTSLVLALLQVGGHPPKAAPEVLEQVVALDGDYHFETYFSLSCQNCPDIVQALNLMSVVNPRITHTAIDGALFKDEVDSRKVMAALETRYIEATGVRALKVRI